MTPQSPSPARTAFFGGRILTMDRVVPYPDVVIVEGDRIAARGDRDLLQAFPDAARIALRGRLLRPGFIDAHNHLSVAALHPLWADLSQVRTHDELRTALAEQAAREPGARWIRGFGWSEAHGGLFLDRADLDALGFDRPVIVAHFTLHQCVVSSHGLEELGIGRETPDPPGGLIARRPDGTPSGLLVEGAWSEAQARSIAAYHDPERFADLYAERCRTLLRDGITAVHDAACSPSAEAVYRSLAASGRLPISVLMMLHPEGILAPLDERRLDGPPTGEGDEWLRVGPVKLFADGGASPAIDIEMGGSHLEMGIAFPGVEASARKIVDRGFGLAVHAIGNAGLATALRAFAGCDRLRRDRDLRWRVEHAVLASAEQLGEMAALGAIGVVQPGFVGLIGDFAQGFQLERELWLPFADMARLGVPLAASSDDPCSFHQPLLTSACGTTRCSASGHTIGPEQALGYEEWLRAYTAGAAWAGGQEHERGRLTPGKRADLVVLEGELDAEHPPTVAETWVAGRCAWRRA